jgi:carbonic anhydrase
VRRRPDLIGLAFAGALFAGAITGCGSADDGTAAESTAAGTAAPFGYGSEDGPAEWASLDPAYAQCAEGKEQSPIDLTDAQASDLPRIEISYHPSELEVENNGHSLEGLPPPGNSVEVEGTRYELDQFHFHAPSEHRSNGRALPIEFHFVNRSADGEPLVLGVFVQAGRENPAAAKLIESLPRTEGETLQVHGDVDLLDLLPADPAAAPRWSYDGSLTTPPCTEGVAWKVFKQPIEMSPQQIAAFTSIYDGNNRPVQPLNGRELIFGS